MYHHNKMTGNKLAKMLKENTGRHMLDSGGAYGRHWERNQLTDFENEPRYTTYNNELVTFSLFHFLRDRLIYDHRMAGLTGAFKRYVFSTPEFSRIYTNSTDDAVEWMMAAPRLGEEWEMICSYNTYNGEDALSQVIQYAILESDFSSQLIALSIHNGCDVRGGYTDVAFFEFQDDWYSILDNSQFWSQCPKCDHNWYYESAGYYAYYNGSTAEGPEPDGLRCPDCGCELEFYI